MNRYLSFDSLGRIARQVNGDGLTGREFTYSALGRLVRDAPISWIDTTPQQEPSNPCTGSQFYDPNDPWGNNCTFDPPTEPQPSGYWWTGSGTVFDYDGAGNRTDQGGTYGAGNRIRLFAGCTYVTDSTGDGNVLSRTCGTEAVRFWWSAESRLAALKVVGADSLDFRYDASGRLVRKDLNGSRQAYFLWQGDNLLAELDSTATGKVAEYSYYPGLDNLHAVIVGTTPYFAHADGMGNVIALTDSATQNVQRSYTYDAWGQLVGGTDGKPFTNADRARFKGALWFGPQADVYYMRARWYEPKAGRFLSEDPAGLAGGVNSYAYAFDDPVNWSDPTGLCPVSLYNWNTGQYIGPGIDADPGTVMEGTDGNLYVCGKDGAWSLGAEGPFDPGLDQPAGQPVGDPADKKENKPLVQRLICSVLSDTHLTYSGGWAADFVTLYGGVLGGGAFIGESGVGFYKKTGWAVGWDVSGGWENTWTVGQFGGTVTDISGGTPARAWGVGKNKTSVSFSTQTGPTLPPFSARGGRTTTTPTLYLVDCRH